MSTTLLTAHTGCTAEELLRRAEVRELRDKIRLGALERIRIKAAYRHPHMGPEHKAAMAALRAAMGIDPRHDFTYNWHCQPGRHYSKPELTELHVRLATLRGKVHGPRVDSQ